MVVAAVFVLVILTVAAIFSTVIVTPKMVIVNTQAARARDVSVFHIRKN